MSWSDEPSEAQLNAIWSLLKWKLPNEELVDAIEFLRGRATRKEVSIELSRLRKLYTGHTLCRGNCYDAVIWDGFSYKRNNE